MSVMVIDTITKEQGRYYSFHSQLRPGEYFEFRPRNTPLNSKPIVDDEIRYVYWLFRDASYGFMANI